MIKLEWNSLFWRLVFVSFLLPLNAYAKENIVIENGRTVSIEYVLKLDDGSTASTNTGQAPLVYEQGDSQILRALEKALAGLKAGDTKKVLLSPEEGYGPVDSNAFVAVPRELVPEGAREVGALLLGHDSEGNERRVRVHEVHEDRIVIDHNHPLAGENLHFEVKIISVE